MRLETEPQVTTSASGEPVVVVPQDADYANEPALTIGAIFADKAKLGTVIAAVLVLIAMVGINVPADFSDKLTGSLNVLVPLIPVIWLGVRSSLNAKTQAQETRASVFSPASTKKLLEKTRQAA